MITNIKNRQYKNLVSLVTFTMIAALLCQNVAWACPNPRMDFKSQSEEKLAAKSLFEWVRAHSKDYEQKKFKTEMLDSLLREGRAGKYVFNEENDGKFPPFVLSKMKGIDKDENFFKIQEGARFQYSDNKATITAIIDGHTVTLTFFKDPDLIEVDPAIELADKDIATARIRGYWVQLLSKRDDGEGRLAGEAVVGDEGRRELDLRMLFISLIAGLTVVFFINSSYGLALTGMLVLLIAYIKKGSRLSLTGSIVLPILVLAMLSGCMGFARAPKTGTPEPRSAYVIRDFDIDEYVERVTNLPIDYRTLLAIEKSGVEVLQTLGDCVTREDCIARLTLSDNQKESLKRLLKIALEIDYERAVSLLNSIDYIGVAYLQEGGGQILIYKYDGYIISDIKNMIFLNKNLARYGLDLESGGINDTSILLLLVLLHEARHALDSMAEIEDLKKQYDRLRKGEIDYGEYLSLEKGIRERVALSDKKVEEPGYCEMDYWLERIISYIEKGGLPKGLLSGLKKLHKHYTFICKHVGDGGEQYEGVVAELLKVDPISHSEGMSLILAVNSYMEERFGISGDRIEYLSMDSGKDEIKITYRIDEGEVQEIIIPRAELELNPEPEKKPPLDDSESSGDSNTSSGLILPFLIGMLSNRSKSGGSGGMAGNKPLGRPGVTGGEEGRMITHYSVKPTSKKVYRKAILAQELAENGYVVGTGEDSRTIKPTTKLIGLWKKAEEKGLKSIFIEKRFIVKLFKMGKSYYIIYISDISTGSEEFYDLGVFQRAERKGEVKEGAPEKATDILAKAPPFVGRRRAKSAKEDKHSFRMQVIKAFIALRAEGKHTLQGIKDYIKDKWGTDASDDEITSTVDSINAKREERGLQKWVLASKEGKEAGVQRRLKKAKPAKKVKKRGEPDRWGLEETVTIKSKGIRLGHEPGHYPDLGKILDIYDDGLPQELDSEIPDGESAVEMEEDGEGVEEEEVSEEDERTKKGTSGKGKGRLYVHPFVGVLALGVFSELFFGAGIFGYFAFSLLLVTSAGIVVWAYLWFVDRTVSKDKYNRLFSMLLEENKLAERRYSLGRERRMDDGVRFKVSLGDGGKGGKKDNFIVQEEKGMLKSVSLTIGEKRYDLSPSAIKQFNRSFLMRRKILAGSIAAGIAGLASGIFAYRRDKESPSVELPKETMPLKQRVVEKLKRLVLEIEDEKHREYARLFVKQFEENGEIINTPDGRKSKDKFYVRVERRTGKIIFNYLMFAISSDTLIKGHMVHEGKHIYDYKNDDKERLRVQQLDYARSLYSEWKEKHSRSLEMYCANDLIDDKSNLRTVTFRGVTFRPADILLAHAKLFVEREFRAYQEELRYYAHELGKQRARMAEINRSFRKNSTYMDLFTIFGDLIFERPELYPLLEKICFDDQTYFDRVLKELRSMPGFEHGLDIMRFKEYIFSAHIFSLFSSFPESISDNGTLDRSYFFMEYFINIVREIGGQQEREVFSGINRLEIRARRAEERDGRIFPNYDGGFLEWLNTGVFEDVSGERIVIDDIDLSIFPEVKEEGDDSRDIGGSWAGKEHRTRINPKLVNWVYENQSGAEVKVLDYYYENGRWVPYKVKYIEDIAFGRLKPGEPGYYKENGDPVDKGEPISDDRCQMSDKEQRRLNETLKACGYNGELIHRLRFRVILGETAAAWGGDLNHSSLVHVGWRGEICWYGEGLFRDLLSRDVDSLRKEIFAHEKGHLEGEEGIDSGHKYRDLAREVNVRCRQIGIRRTLKKMRKMREHLGWSLEDMVSALPGSVRIDTSNLSEIERGTHSASDELVEAIHKIWKRNIGKILKKKRCQICKSLEDMATEQGIREPWLNSDYLLRIEEGNAAPSFEFVDAVKGLWRKEIGLVLRNKRTDLGIEVEHMPEILLREGIRISWQELNKIELGDVEPEDELIDAINRVCIKGLREQLDLSQDDLEEEMLPNIKVSQSTLSRIERGTYKAGNYELIEAIVGMLRRKKKERKAENSSGLKAPGDKGIYDEDSGADINFIADLVKDAEGRRLEQGQIDALLSVYAGIPEGKETPSEGLLRSVEIHVVDINKPGIPKNKDAVKPQHLIYTLGSKGRIKGYNAETGDFEKVDDGKLHICVTKAFWDQYLSPLPVGERGGGEGERGSNLMLAFLIDHEWQENIVLPREFRKGHRKRSFRKTRRLFHRIASRRMWLFVDEDGMNPFHRFFIDQIAKEGEIEYLRGLLIPHKNDPMGIFMDYVRQSLLLAETSNSLLLIEIDNLYEYLDNVDLGLFKPAAEILAEIAKTRDGRIVCDIVEKLLKKLDRGSEELRRAVVYALAGIAKAKDTEIAGYIINELFRRLNTFYKKPHMDTALALAEIAKVKADRIAKSIIDRLCKVLSAGYPDGREAAAVAIGEVAGVKSGLITQDVVDGLFKLIEKKGEEQYVVEAGIEALARIAIVSSEYRLNITYKLFGKLKNVSAGMKKVIMTALAHVAADKPGLTSEDIINRLFGKLNARMDWEMRESSVFAFTEIIKIRHALIPSYIFDRLSDRIEDGHYRVQIAAVMAFREIARFEPNLIKQETVDRISGKLGSDYFELRQNAALTLAEVAKVRPELIKIDVINELLINMGDNYFEGRESAAICLGTIARFCDKFRAGIVDRLFTDLRSKKWEMQESVAIAFGEVGKRRYGLGKTIIDELFKMLDSKSADIYYFNVRNAAGLALANIANEKPDLAYGIVYRLFERLGNHSFDINRTASMALARIAIGNNNLALDIVNVLLSKIGDDDVRIDAGQALSEISRHNHGVIVQGLKDRLFNRLNASHWGVRKELSEELEKSEEFLMDKERGFGLDKDDLGYGYYMLYALSCSNNVPGLNIITEKIRGIKDYRHVKTLVRLAYSYYRIGRFEEFMRIIYENEKGGTEVLLRLIKDGLYELIGIKDMPGVRDRLDCRGIVNLLDIARRHPELLRDIIDDLGQADSNIKDTLSTLKDAVVLLLKNPGMALSTAKQLVKVIPQGDSKQIGLLREQVDKLVEEATGRPYVILRIVDVIRYRILKSPSLQDLAVVKAYKEWVESDGRRGGEKLMGLGHEITEWDRIEPSRKDSVLGICNELIGLLEEIYSEGSIGMDNLLSVYSEWDKAIKGRQEVKDIVRLNIVNSAAPEFTIDMLEGIISARNKLRDVIYSSAGEARYLSIKMDNGLEMLFYHMLRKMRKEFSSIQMVVRLLKVLIRNEILNGYDTRPIDAISKELEDTFIEGRESYLRLYSIIRRIERLRGDLTADITNVLSEVKRGVIGRGGIWEPGLSAYEDKPLHPYREVRPRGKGEGLILLPEQYTRDNVGDKAFRLKDITQGELELKHITLGFGLCEYLINLPENKELKRGLRRFINRLSGMRRADSQAIRRQLSSIRTAIESLVIPSDMLWEIRTSIMNKIGYGLVCLIPSTNIRDYTGDGLYDSFSAVDPNNLSQLEKYIKKVLSSAWTMRAYHDREVNNIRHTDVRMSVLVQKMVPAEYSFRVYTINPVNAKEDEMLVEVVQGLGETLTNDKYPGSPHRFVYNKKDGSIRVVSFADKAHKLILKDRGIAEEAINYNMDILVKDSSLRDRLLSRIAGAAMDIERMYGRAQSISGCIVREYGDYKFGFVQSRDYEVLSARETAGGKSDSTWLYRNSYASEPISRLQREYLEQAAHNYLERAGNSGRIIRVFGPGIDDDDDDLPEKVALAKEYIGRITDGMDIPDNISIAILIPDPDETEPIGFSHINRVGDMGFCAVTAVGGTCSGERPYAIYMRLDDIEGYMALGEEGDSALINKLMHECADAERKLRGGSIRHVDEPDEITSSIDGVERRILRSRQQEFSTATGIVAAFREAEEILTRPVVTDGDINRVSDLMSTPVVFSGDDEISDPEFRYYADFLSNIYMDTSERVLVNAGTSLGVCLLLVMDLNAMASREPETIRRSTIAALGVVLTRPDLTVDGNVLAFVETLWKIARERQELKVYAIEIIEEMLRDKRITNLAISGILNLLDHIVDTEPELIKDSTLISVWDLTDIDRKTAAQIAGFLRKAVVERNRLELDRCKKEAMELVNLAVSKPERADDLVVYFAQILADNSSSTNRCLGAIYGTGELVLHCEISRIPEMRLMAGVLERDDLELADTMIIFDAMEKMIRMAPKLKPMILTELSRVCSLVEEREMKECINDFMLGLMLGAAEKPRGSAVGTEWYYTGEGHSDVNGEIGQKMRDARYLSCKMKNGECNIDGHGNPEALKREWGLDGVFDTKLQELSGEIAGDSELINYIEETEIVLVEPKNPHYPYYLSYLEDDGEVKEFCIMHPGSYKGKGQYVYMTYQTLRDIPLELLLRMLRRDARLARQRFNERQILRQIPASVRDFLLGNFPDNWEMALVLLGEYIFDAARWPFIKRCLRQDTKDIKIIAEILRQERPKIEDFPDEFVDFVIRNMALMVDIRALYFFYTEYRNPALRKDFSFGFDWDSGRDARVENLRMMRRESELSGTRRKGLTDKQLINISKYGRKPKFVVLPAGAKAKLSSGAVEYDLSEEIRREGSQLRFFDLKAYYHENIFYGHFLVLYSKDEELNRMLREVCKEDEGGDWNREGLPVVSFVRLGGFNMYEKLEDPGVIEIELHAVIRSSYRIDKKLREKIEDLERITEWAFRKVAPKLPFGIRKIVAKTSPGGILHPNTVARLNEVYLNAGYHLEWDGKSHRFVWVKDLTEDGRPGGFDGEVREILDRFRRWQGHDAERKEEPADGVLNSV